MGRSIPRPDEEPGTREGHGFGWLGPGTLSSGLKILQVGISLYAQIMIQSPGKNKTKQNLSKSRDENKVPVTLMRKEATVVRIEWERPARPLQV